MSYYEKKLPELPDSFLTPPIELFLRAVGKQIDDILTFREDVIDQLFVQTATWGLQHWERQLGLSVGESLPVEIRRARIFSALLCTEGMRPADLQKALAVIGFLGYEIVELFKSLGLLPLHNAAQTYSGGWRTGNQWAMFKVRFGINDWRDLRDADKQEIKRIIEKTKPAHMALSGLELVLFLNDQLEQITDEKLIIVRINPGESFLRAGLRHSGQVRYRKVLIHDASFLHDSEALHNRLVPGGMILHQCNDESASLQALVQLADAPRIFTPRDGWQRLGLWYSGASALDRSAATASLRLTDAVPETADAIEPVSRLGLADHFAGETLAHGVFPWPQRTSAVLYRSRYLHQPRAPRNGASAYGDHLPRFLGPRRDGRHRYGGTLQEKLEAFEARVSLEDKPVTQLPRRNGSFFYRDKELYHGPCPAPVEASGYALAWQGVDNFGLPGDQVASKVNIIGNDVYPGRDPIHGAPEQPLHDGSIYHKFAGNYGWRGDRYSGQRYHGKAPMDKPEAVVAKLSLGDMATGHYLYGGDRLRHDGGGLRWKHHGMLLRRPFARHDALWLRDGARRYLEARARYGDLVVMHDGIDQYGVSGGLHDGTVLRRPVMAPDDMVIIVRRGYRRVAV